MGEISYGTAPFRYLLALSNKPFETDSRSHAINVTYRLKSSKHSDDRHHSFNYYQLFKEL